jgi:hypothetical protein
MAGWFGVGLLAIGMITWFARDEAASLAGRAIARAGPASVTHTASSTPTP